MPAELITLEGAPDIILCPLYFLSMFPQFAVCFAITEDDEFTHEFRRICCLRPDPLAYLPRPKRPALFEIIGQIAEHDCYLTARGDEDHQEPDDPVASCWVEARPDDVSRIYWRSLLPTIREIMDVIPGAVDSSKLVAGNDEAVESVRMQVIWRAPDGETIAEALPIYDGEGVRRVPTCLADVPFGRAMRFIFTLEYYHQRNNPRTRVIYANLFHIVYV